MKELSIEEKAKAYDDAVKKLKILHDDWAATHNRAAKEVEEIFPELKESEDERIRKAIITYLKQRKDRSSSIPAAIGSWIAWLEKQGEQILANSVKTCKDEQKPAEWDSRDDSYFEELTESSGLNELQISWLKEIKERVVPRSKQEWCEEDEKINYALMNLVERQTNYPTKWYSWLKSLKYRIQPQEKQEWSEEDKDNLEYVLEIAEEGKPLDVLGICFLESLKDRVQLQPKQEWSEDEKAMIDEMHEFFDKHKFPSLKHDLNEYAKFLKSLQPQSHWKPSEEQMEALRIAAYEPTKNWKEELQTLYMELKKLTE